ncbi:hypothetical protein SAMN05877809_11514 [Rhodobacter sp. JA431]|nr:hypothetical protein SAMN05877809_11514 [Rhodobacter sp. JA431]
MKLIAPLAISTAIFGAIRDYLGMRLVEGAFSRSQHLNCDDLRRLAWNKARKHAWLLRGRADCDNRFDIPWEPLVFHRLCRRLKQMPNYKPPAVHGDPVEMADRPLFVATVHCRIGHATLRHLFEQTGRPISLICSAGNAATLRERADLYGDVPVEPIIFDAKCYLAARRAFRHGRIVVSCIDYTERKPRWLSHDIWLDSSMFALPLKCGADILFALPEVTDDGMLKLHARRIISERSTAAICEDFADFVTRHWSEREPRRIAPHGRQRNDLKLKSHLWVPSRTRRKTFLPLQVPSE